MASAKIPIAVKMAATVAILFCLTGGAVSQSAPERPAPPSSARPAGPPSIPIESGPARVVLMRGLMNVFSLGMDGLAEKLRADGISAAVYNHVEGPALAPDIAQRYRTGDRRPIILVGHSLGADAALLMAEQLNGLGVPVSLIVLFDGTQPIPVSSNVARVLNFTLRIQAVPGPGFQGEIVNMDVSREPGIEHTTLDKSPVLQSAAINKINAVVAETAPPTAPGAAENAAPLAPPPVRN